MTILRAIAAITLCTILAGAIGGAAGFALGSLAPNYYRGVALQGWEPRFDAASFGFGQGLSQGIASGMLVGIAVVAVLSWREIRMNSSASLSPTSQPRRSASTALAWRLFLLAGVLLGLGVLLPAAVLLGGIIGERGAYHRRYLEEREAIVQALRGDPALASIEVREFSGGGVYLSGDLLTPADLGRVRDRIVQAIGESRAADALLGVGVRPPSHRDGRANERS